MLLTVLYLFRRARGSRNPVKNLMARKDLVIREEDLKSSEDKENKNKVNLLIDFFLSGAISTLRGGEAEIFLHMGHNRQKGGGADCLIISRKRLVLASAPFPMIAFSSEGQKHTISNFIRGLCPTTRYATGSQGFK